MARTMVHSAKKPRISIDVDSGLRKWLRLAAARRDLTIRQHVLRTLEERLREDLGADSEGILALAADADPVLARLWGNSKDAQYDQL
jgi:hypothetical protein